MYYGRLTGFCVLLCVDVSFYEGFYKDVEICDEYEVGCVWLRTYKFK